MQFVEPLYRSKQTEKQEAHSKMTSVVSWLLLFFSITSQVRYFMLYIVGSQGINIINEENRPTNYQIIQLFLGNNCWLCIRVSSQIPLRTIGYIAQKKGRLQGFFILFYLLFYPIINMLRVLGLIVYMDGNSIICIGY